MVAVVDCDLSALGDNPLLRQMEADAGDRVQLAVPRDMPVGVLLSTLLLRSLKRDGSQATRIHSRLPALDGSSGTLDPTDMGEYALDVLIKSEWQAVPMSTLVGEIVLLNSPCTNDITVRVNQSDDRARLQRHGCGVKK